MEKKKDGSPSTEASALLSNGHGHSHGHQHDHSDSHAHAHDHDHAESASDSPVLKRLKIATALCLTFMAIEVVGGYWAGSLAVLSDAAHLMADLASFGVAIAAAYLAARPSTPQHTYGLKRTESLAALFSMVTLAVLSLALALEAIRRIFAMTMHIDTTDPVDGKVMSGIATIGVLVNLALAAVLGENHTHLPGHHDNHSHDHSHSHNHSHPPEDTDRASIPIHAHEVLPEDSSSSPPPQRNVNLHAAYLHVMADLAQSVAVLFAGLVIWWNPRWKIVDPIATILFCCLVIASTFSVIRSAICVLLEEVPPHISWQTIYTQIQQQLPDLTDIHDLHIWSISHGINALSVHVILGTATTTPTYVNSVLAKIATIARTNGISHSTIQVQTADNTNYNTHPDCITCAMADESQSCVAFAQP